jgi:hypothetical protein
MKRYLCLLAIVMGSLIVGSVIRGQAPGVKPPADLGPGDGGAALKLPGMDSVDPKGASRTDVPDSLKNLWSKSAPGASAFPKPAQPGGTKVAEPPSNPTDMNKDIEIDAKAGNFVIFVMAYSGPKAPEMARKFVAVMRSHYKWNAYVFNYGAEEKRKEYERVQKVRQEQIDALKKEGLDADLPIRVAAIRIDEQTGVLLGGYKTRDEAAAALKILKDEKKTDPQFLIGKVDLDKVFTAKVDRTAPGKGPKVLDDEMAYVNPFKKAFVARNPHPDVPKEQPGGMTPEEQLKLLRIFNREEPLTVLNCKKPFTLVIKQFDMQQTTLADARQVREANAFMKGLKESNTILDMVNKGLMRGGKETEWVDRAAHNAHNLAKGMRENKIEAYVLHSKYCSYVTVGNYDSLQDPQLLAMQSVLEPMLKSDAYRALDLLPQAVPMLVPGVRAR